MWLEFRKKIWPFRVFSTKDIEKQFPGMNLMNLVRWQEKGYILKIRNSWYAFSDAESHENMEWLAANLIYAPSYISLHTALSWYNLIPEMVSTTTSVTTRKTNTFSTPLGIFDYHTIKPEIFGFGYHLENADAYSDIHGNGRKIMVASPQKAILDFFYINSYYNSEKDLENLRLNKTELVKIVNDEFYLFLTRYKSKTLEYRIGVMIKTYGL